MSKNNFYEKQTALTAAKIEIYQKYLKGYLPKLLIQFGSCVISDLFCGSGKNGDEDGSPLVLIKSAKYILSSVQLKEKQIHILFNDQDPVNIKNLNRELSKLEFENNIHIIQILKEKFEILLPRIIAKYKNNNIPKFFFLDPFTYSNVKMKHLEQLMSLANTEVLLFLPIFLSYRFASDNTMKEDHRTRMFVEQFTINGIADYQNVYDFMYSIKEKLLKELSLDYVRPVLLDSGASKNSLFLLTKHQAGMLLMNKIALKLSEDGSKIKVKTQKEPSFFPMEEISTKFSNFENKIIEQLRNKKQMTNDEIIDFSIREEFQPKHGKEIIEKLFKKNIIKVYDIDRNEINNKTQWNIAEKITKTIFFVWEKL